MKRFSKLQSHLQYAKTTQAHEINIQKREFNNVNLRKEEEEKNKWMKNLAYEDHCAWNDNQVKLLINVKLLLVPTTLTQNKLQQIERGGYHLKYQQTCFANKVTKVALQ